MHNMYTTPLHVSLEDLDDCLRCPYIIISKCSEIILHPISRDNYDRQYELLEKFMKYIDDIFVFFPWWLGYIPHLIVVLEHLTLSLNVYPKFIIMLRQIFEISKNAPYRVKYSEILKYKADLVQYFTTLGYISICYKNEELGGMALDAIKSLLTSEPKNEKCISKDDRIFYVKYSYLPELLGNYVIYIDDFLYPRILRLIIILARKLPEICKRVAVQNSLEYLIRRLEPNWKQRNIRTRAKMPSLDDKVLNRDDSFTCIWLILFELKEEAYDIPPPSIYALQSLQYCLRRFAVDSLSYAHRNNVMGIILHLLKVFPKLPLLESGLAHDLVKLAVLTEQKSDDEWLKYVRFLNDNESYLFKKMLIASLMYFPKHSSLKAIRHKCVFANLTKTFLNKSRWPDMHHLILIADIFRVVETIISNACEEMFESKIASKCIEMARCYGEFPIVAINCLSCLFQILWINNRVINEMILDNNAIEVFTDLLQKLIARNDYTIQYQKIFGYAFCIIQRLCRLRMPKLEPTFTICLSFLKRIKESKSNETLLETKVVIAMMHYLWTVIDSSIKFAQKFVKCGGVYILLDITQNSTKEVKVMTLGILVNLCYLRFGISQTITWRKNNQDIKTLLCCIYRTPDRCLKYLELNPEDFNILSDDQRIICVKAKENEEQFLNLLRPKIYALIYLLDQKYAELTDVTNQHFRLYYSKLSIDNQVTLLFAKNYLSLEVCENWLKVIEDVFKEDIPPTGDEKERLQNLRDMIYNWRRYLKEQAMNIMKLKKIQEQVEEIGVYEKIRKSKLSIALPALQEVLCLARCTMRIWRIRSKLQDENSINQCIHPRSLKNFHRTYQNTVDVTPPYNQYLNIKSNTLFNPSPDIFNLKLVSPISSTVSIAKSDITILERGGDIKCAK